MFTKFNKFINKYNVSIIAFLIALLHILTFYAGAMYSCQNGFMQGMVCVKPKQVATVKVCEFGLNCFETCKVARVSDLQKFNETFKTAIWE